MTACAVDMAVRQYAHQQGELDDYRDAVNARIDTLTAKGGECYPFTTKNMQEAIGNWGDNRDLVLAHCLENDLPCQAMMTLWIESYWLVQAEKIAIGELS